MKRAAIMVLAIATLVLIVTPSAYPLASSPAKSGTSTPSVIAPSLKPGTGPSSLSGGGTGGGGADQGDADGLSGMKIKPVTQSGFALPTDRVAIALMMWWRYMVLIR